MCFIFLFFVCLIFFWLIEKFGPKPKTPPRPVSDRDVILSMLLLDEITEPDHCDDQGWDE